MKIADFPLIRTTFWFVLGIIVAYYINLPFSVILISVSLVLGLLLISFYKANQTLGEQKLFFSIATYSAFFILGVATKTIHNDRIFDNHYSHFDNFFDKNHEIELVIEEKLRDNKSYNRYVTKIVSVNHQNISGKVLLNINREDIESDFVSGTIVKVNDQLVKNFNLKNPNQFDYSKYLEDKNIYAQLYVYPHQVAVGKVKVKGLFYYASAFRNRIINNLQKSGFGKNELAVIMALILGQQQEISQEIIRDYQYAGAVHILSVSGLHVGFILLFISFLLKPLPNTKFWNTLKLLIILLSLWVFALVAGLAPSVVRSAAMFSFVAIGMNLRRHTNMYHTIVVSLFVILLFQPNFLFDVGFQLSYLALFFIVWLQPEFKKLWYPKNKIANYFWEIITVSFAAQIGTLPLSIYYFHQFPGLFFVTNLVLIPCLIVIMALGLVLVLLAYFDFTPYILTETVEVLIKWMNQFINLVASVESFVIKEIPLSFPLLIASYFAITSFVLWIKNRNFQISLITLVSILVLQLMLFYTKWETQNNSEMIVFNSSTNTIITSRLGAKVSLYSTQKLLKEDFNYKMAQNYATSNFSRIVELKKLNNVLSFNGKKILVLNFSTIENLKCKPDIVIINQSPKLNLERFLKQNTPKIIIADATNYKSYVEKWEKTCEKLKVPFHSIYKNGYYKID